jgi:hypothetical protein
MFTPHAVALPQKKRTLQGRRLVVVDIENVTRGAVVTKAMAEWARNVVVSALAVAEGEQVVLATSHIGLFHSKSAWPSARVKARSRDDGADLELLDVLTTEHIEERFDEVVLVSGDGIFAEAVARFGSAGVTVTVASWAESLSTRLRLAAGRTVYLNEWVGKTHKEIA